MSSLSSSAQIDSNFTDSAANKKKTWNTFLMKVFLSKKKVFSLSSS